MVDFSDIIPKDFNGCIMVRDEKEVVFQGAYGYRDLPNMIDNEMDTRFATASAGKVFVAVGILKLIEEGELALEDTISDILDIDLRGIDRDITIEQLLTHTSGIPDYFDEETMDDYEELWKDFPNYRIRRSSDLIPLFIDKPMLYKPRERFQYNNTGFVVLGLIIEEVSGMDFDEYLRINIFEPSGMKDTGYFELDRLPARCAGAYIYDDKRGDYYTNIYSVDAKGSGAGGAFTTVLDISRFWEHLMGGRLISPQVLKEMLRPQSEAGYGYGIWLKKMEDGSFLPYIQGEDPGVSFISYYDITGGSIVTVVSNFGNDVWTLAGSILMEVTA